jgi:hypothetical protein
MTKVIFEMIDAGELAIARFPEPLAMLWIHLTFPQPARPRFGTQTFAALALIAIDQTKTKIHFGASIFCSGVSLARRSFGEGG